MKYKAVASFFGRHGLISCFVLPRRLQENEYCNSKHTIRHGLESMRKHNRIFLSFLINQYHWF
ncbi:hypothetical protein FVEG_05241 [Fusarium verticillioides 7600]|uniref:Uncharacterized protein n=1 Tax=Gibberella moniliformis (strain M3125 / FGSC 7600) TaxID=334819 RepID=W7M8X8_GIBM7|nr:hypothetical protein FVEG_05241 [Fusarium verticillioides 7600]EWG44025.1 hypothetical protein FVEG_05241 [Fusarium verticillioides 7600]